MDSNERLKVLSVEREALYLDTIIFSTEDYEKVKRPHSDPLVINILLNRYTMRRTLIDNGSSVNLINLEVYEKLIL